MAEPEIRPAPKHLKSDVWNHFGFYNVDGGNELDKSYVVCKICRAKLKYFGTTNLRSHTARFHPTEELRKPAAAVATSSLRTTEDTLKKEPKTSKKAKRITNDEEPSPIVAPIEESDLDEHFNLKPCQVSEPPRGLQPETLIQMASANAVEVKTENDQGVRELGLDAAIFWGHCNTAGCTEAIFSDFLTDMKDVFLRIQNCQASQDDFNVALQVMLSSGKMTELLRKQQKELEHKQVAVQKSVAAMQEVMSLLSR
ncbi:uncharacterized protein LOC133159831 isoform X2 [Syngnathus typhle]|uniref:uncharacterized protein LOC133159831 isoform X2 n=1 Tax=Syngnathus typhle TaxID=161592 RepID=UPI002A6A6926|nr:uncharacterized protein LOC133159831 isoform X2 [Syngnathus typhle]